MKFIYYVRTPLPPFHWVLSLSQGWSKFNSVVKYYPFGKKVKMIYQQISPLIKLRRQNAIRLFWFDIPWTRNRT